MATDPLKLIQVHIQHARLLVLSLMIFLDIHKIRILPKPSIPEIQVLYVLKEEAEVIAAIKLVKFILQKRKWQNMSNHIFKSNSIAHHQAPTH